MRTCKMLAAITLAGIMAAVPGMALADVKDGIDMWNRGEYRNAVEEWRPAAIAGDPQAQFNLGQAYKLGRGVPVDMPMAESWYRKAALQGLPQAEANYALALFDKGARTEALPWLEKSVSRGEPRAQLVLGTMLFNGDGVAKDWRRAYALMMRSSAAGIPTANKVLAQMDQYIPQDMRQEGIVLARQYETAEQRAELPPEIAGNGNRAAMRGAELPPSSFDQNGGQAVAVNQQVRRAPVPAQPAVRATVARAPLPTPVAQPTPRPAPPVMARAGAWRIQLGAFGDPNNAHKLWAQVGSRFPGQQSYFVKTGNLTRLLVGPYASNADATRACAAVKPCVPVGG